MSDEADWGPWVDHDGRGCPLPVGTVIEGVFERRPGRYVIAVGTVGPHDMGLSWDWSWWMQRAPDGFLVSRLIRYRVRRPKALRDLIALVETLPAPVQPTRMPEEVAP